MHDQPPKPWRHRVGMIAAEAVGGLIVAGCMVLALLVAVPFGKWFANFMASLGGGG